MTEKNKHGFSSVSQPHDKLVKRLLSNAETAREILAVYLPEDVLKVVNLNQLSLQRDSFIDDEHRVFAVDLLFKTTFEEEEGYLWILLEHQSTSDPWLPVRIFKYIATIWDHLRKTSKSHKIPLIYPLVIYNGARPYSHSLNLKDLIEPNVSQDLFEDFFRKPFSLVDLNTIEDSKLKEDLQNSVKGVALLMTLKHIFDKNLEAYFEQTLIVALNRLDQEGNRDDVVDLLQYIVREGKSLDKNRFKALLHEKFDRDIEDKVMTVAQQLRAEGMQEGIARGLAQGIELGIERGMEQGIGQGIEQGKLKAKFEVAQRMLTENVDIALIAKLTGLSRQQVKELQTEIIF